MKQPTSFADLYGDHLNAGNFSGRKITLTIASVRHAMYSGERETDPEEKKVVMTFKETERKYVLPLINATCMAAMFGTHLPDWTGHKVTLYPTNKVMPFPLSRKDKDAGLQPEACIRVWGSPELKRDLDVQFKPKRRRPLTITLHAPERPVEPRKTAETPTETPEPPETPTHASSGDDEPFGEGDVNLDLDI